MTCPQCNREITANSNFCYYCGSRQVAPGGAAAPGPASSWGNAPGPAYKRRLMRSATDVKLAGVCAGVAEYFDTDATIVRLVWALLAFFTGIFPGLVLYILGWIIMPVAPLPAPMAAPQASASHSAQTA